MTPLRCSFPVRWRQYEEGLIPSDLIDEGMSDAYVKVLTSGFNFSQLVAIHGYKKSRPFQIFKTSLDTENSVLKMVCRRYVPSG
jgi:hypothetical protein